MIINNKKLQQFYIIVALSTAYACTLSSNSTSSSKIASNQFEDIDSLSSKEEFFKEETIRYEDYI